MRVTAAAGLRSPAGPCPPRDDPELQGLAAGSGHADADEQPRPRGCRAPRPAHRLRRLGPGGAQLGRLRRHRGLAAGPGGRRDPAGPVRQAGRRVPHPRMGAAGTHRQLQPRAPVGQLGGVPPPGGRRADHVRADDRRVLDLHRHPGHPAGHLRDLRRGRRQAVRRHAGRDHHADRRPGRDGRRPAARRHHERRRRAVRGLRPVPDHPPHRARLPRRPGRRHRRRHRGGPAAAAQAGQPLSIGLLGNAAEIVPQLLRMDAPINIVTDQTSPTTR